MMCLALCERSASSCKRHVASYLSFVRGSWPATSAGAALYVYRIDPTIHQLNMDMAITITTTITGSDEENENLVPVRFFRPVHRPCAQRLLLWVVLFISCVVNMKDTKKGDGGGRRHGLACLRAHNTHYFYFALLASPSRAPSAKFGLRLARDARRDSSRSRRLPDHDPTTSKTGTHATHKGCDRMNYA